MQQVHAINGLALVQQNQQRARTLEDVEATVAGSQPLTPVASGHALPEEPSSGA